MSIRSPEKKPRIMPSFFPLIIPKEATTIINKFGVIFTKSMDGNTVVCNTKHMEIIKNKTIKQRTNQQKEVACKILQFPFLYVIINRKNISLLFTSHFA